MHITPVALQGSKIRLAPIVQEMTDEIAACALTAPAEVWRFLPYPVRDRADVARLVATALALHASGAGACFAMRMCDTGEMVGATAIFRADEAHRRVEIGSTWIVPRWQRTFVNTEAKLLQLAHCFGELACIRVEFKTDAENGRSRMALRAIGATEEGVLRRHLVCWDGHVRDSAYFSVVDTEWPRVRALLEARLDSRSRSRASEGHV